MELTPGARLGPYRILASLGSGHFGAVYLAQDERLDRRVALKMLSAGDADARRRLDKEARAIARLNHANIAALYDVIEQDDRAVLVMEHVDGVPLSTLVTSPPIGVDRAIDIGLQLTDALAYAHREGIIHRDVKPSNVMLTRAGKVKLLDLGVAIMTERENAPTTSATESMVGAGTPAYMAPERFQGQSADARTDVYSVGVLLFELLTGRRPYPDSDLLTLTMAIATMPTPHVREQNPNVPRVLDEIVFKAMARNPATRYATAGELHEALLRAKDSQYTQPGPEPALSGFRGGRAVLLLLLAVLATLVASLWWGRSKSVNAPLAAATLAVPPVNVTTAGVDEANVEELASFLQSVVARNLKAFGLKIVPGSEAPTNGGPPTTAQSTPSPGYTTTLSLNADTSTTSIEAGLQHGSDARPTWHESSHGDALQLVSFAVRGLASAVETDYARNHDVSEGARARALPTENSEALTSYLKGRTLLDTSDDSETDQRAVASFLAAIQLDPLFAYAQAGLSQAYSSLGKHSATDAAAQAKWLDRARSEALSALKRDPSCDQAYLALSTVSYLDSLLRKTSGKADEAVSQAKEAVLLTPDSDDAHRILGVALVNQGKQPDGLAELQRAVVLRPDHWMNYYALGRNLLVANRYADAVEVLKQVKEHLPNFESAYVNLGRAYLGIGDWDRAVGMLELALSRDSSDRFASNNLGTVYFWDGKFDRARGAFLDAIKQSPEDPKLFMNLGDANLALGKKSEAKTAYNTCINLADKQKEKAVANAKEPDAGTEAIAAKCLAELGDFENAETRARTALAKDDQNPDVIFKLAVVNALWGKKDRALEWLKKACANGYSPVTLRADPDLRSLRGDPQFAKLVGPIPVR